MVFRRETYGEHYFRCKYKYEGKQKAIERYYTSILKWADGLSDESLLDGEGKKALDIGCAYGFVVKLLDRFGYMAVGVDVSEYAISNGRKIVDEEIFLAEASHLPFKAESFNLVTCFEVLEHLTSPLSALVDVYNCLLPGGVFVATMPTTSLGAKLIGALTRENSSTHSSVKHQNEWIETLSQLKFTKICTDAFLLLPLPPSLFNRYFGLKCWYPFTSHIRVVAVKPF